jgi:triosephosphate isomerase
MHKKIIAGNWKMHGSLAANERLLDLLLAGSEDLACTLVVCAPHVYLAPCARRINGGGVRLGAQDLSARNGGAYTGEISAAMLAEVGCQYVIVGHSERRRLYQDSDEVVARKLGNALAAGLAPILCIGETMAEHQAGRTHAVLAAQLQAALASQPQPLSQQLVIAYEPVWAIGTGLSATPEVVQAAHQFIRCEVGRIYPTASARIPILYGGSMKPENAAALLAMPDVDGGLVGGASLDAADFLAIARAVNLRDQ